MTFEKVLEEVKAEHERTGIVIGSMMMGKFVENPNTEKNIVAFIYKKAMEDLSKSIATGAMAKMKEMGMGDLLG